jgi:hypothetical protein
MSYTTHLFTIVNNLKKALNDWEIIW